MHSRELEMIDLFMTQAIERYCELELARACKVITNEWPEQIAAILVASLFKVTCDEGGDRTNFVPMMRHNTDSFYLLPMCKCRLSHWSAL